MGAPGLQGPEFLKAIPRLRDHPASLSHRISAPFQLRSAGSGSLRLRPPCSPAAVVPRAELSTGEARGCTSPSPAATGIELDRCRSSHERIARSKIIIKNKKRGRPRATGIRTGNRARRDKWKTPAQAPPPASPANGSEAHLKTWCQARILISDELTPEQGHGVVRRGSASASGCRGGGQGTWCQARVLASVGTPEFPEWVWTAISQGTGNEVVTCEKNADCRVGVGGTSALTPSPSSVADYCGGWTLSRSGEGELSAASARCGRPGWTCARREVTGVLTNAATGK